MKILLINFDKGWGGGQEQLKALSLELSNHGHFPHILCRPESPAARNFSALGFPVSTFFAPGRFFLRQLFAIALLFRRDRFDIVLITREHDLIRTALAWKLAFPFGNQGKLVICYHTATVRKQLFINATDAVSCVSTYIRDKLLVGNHRIASSITILPNGIAVSREPAAEKFTIERQRRFFHDAGFPLIGMIGAFFKNQGELIEIIPLLKREFPTVKVALVGDNTDSGLTAPLMEKAKRLGVADNLIFTGKIPHSRLADVYFDLDLSVSTFRNEGFGLIHLESLSAGTPVICYNEGGQKDIFAGTDAGLLIDGSTNEFASAVISLLKDHQRRFKMGRAGVELVKTRFSANTMAKNYIELFSKLTSRRVR